MISIKQLIVIYGTFGNGTGILIPVVEEASIMFRDWDDLIALRAAQTDHGILGKFIAWIRQYHVAALGTTVNSNCPFNHLIIDFGLQTSADIPNKDGLLISIIILLFVEYEIARYATIFAFTID